MCVLQALKDGHDAVLFVDSDMGIQDSSFDDKLIETGYKLNARIIGGCYLMKKSDETVYVAVEKLPNGKIDNLRIKPDKPRLVEGCGTGCMLVFMDVFRKLSDPYFSIIDIFCHIKIIF